VTRKAPLDGIRVIDAATVIAGPAAAVRLGDFGADVIKVEHPVHGDTARNLGWRGPDGEALLWRVISRNKRPVTLDLSKPAGRDLLLRLLAEADVFVESFRPGTLERWGLGPETLHERNPRLVVLRVSGFGQTGPYASRPGFGSLAESMSGLAHLTGPAEGPPVLPPVALADETTGLLGAYAVMLALYHRDRPGGSGRGQVIDASLYDGLFGMTGALATAHDVLGIVPGRTGNRMAYTAPRGTFRTKDGRWVAISGTSQSVARRILEAIGRGELFEDPRFATNEARVRNVVELDEIVQAWFDEHTLDEVMAAFEEHQAAGFPVYDIAQIFADPQYEARGSIARVADEAYGEVAMPAPGPLLSETPGTIRHVGRPIGSANDEVYRDELGLTDEDLQRLRDEGVI
jgi:crotonobetainyl-CoA:carnitine CoA-transferase CaiB-like acyl-CoA transferase